jgi:hypothetical protein
MSRHHSEVGLDHQRESHHDNDLQDVREEDEEAADQEQQQQQRASPLVEAEPQPDCHEYANFTTDHHQQHHIDMGVAAKPDEKHQLHLLRDLLAIERANNEQRHQNNLNMQRYIQRLEEDYLRLQGDLVQALELGHKIKAQKEAQIRCLETTVGQKDTLIEQLQTRLGNLDEAKLRDEFRITLEKQQKLHHLEQDQLKQQIVATEQQLCRERTNNSQLLHQFQQKLDDQLKLHERELANMKLRLAESQETIERILCEPQNLLVKALREDNAQLKSQVDELNLALDETRNRYDSMRKRVDLLLTEQDRLAQQNQDELDRLQQLSVDQRRAYNALKLELDDKQEVIQLLEFNLQRSEKRVKNLLTSLKNKEVTYRELISQSEARQRQETENLNASLKLAEKQLIDMEAQLSEKQNELVRLRLEQENQLESLRNDRDERLSKLATDKTKLAKELQSVEQKLARECEQSNQRAKLAEQLSREVQQFREAGKRLSIELTKSEAKLYAKQQELKAALDSLAEREAERAVGAKSQNRLVSIERELDEERNHSMQLKTNVDELKKANEKLCIKLRIAEANLEKTRSVINHEHEKMMREYEKKMESIKCEQASFDRTKLRYKRYGSKLKKYCEHLKRVHEHLCTPSDCGYIIGQEIDP